MTKYNVSYDKRYKISETITVEAINIEEAKQMAHEYAVENSTTNFDFTNTVVTEQT